MSTNDNHQPSPEERARIVDAAIQESGLNVQNKETLQQQIVNAAFAVNIKVQNRSRPIMSAVKARGSYRREDAQDFIYKMFREEFATWSKEEVLELVSMMYAGAAMGDVEQYMNS